MIRPKDPKSRKPRHDPFAGGGRQLKGMGRSSHARCLDAASLVRHSSKRLVNLMRSRTENYTSRRRHLAPVHGYIVTGTWRRPSHETGLSKRASTCSGHPGHTFCGSGPEGHDPLVNQNLPHRVGRVGRLREDGRRVYANRSGWAALRGGWPENRMRGTIHAPTSNRDPGTDRS